LLSSELLVLDQLIIFVIVCFVVAIIIATRSSFCFDLIAENSSYELEHIYSLVL
jgi:hypothetical protein